VEGRIISSFVYLKILVISGVPPFGILLWAPFQRKNLQLLSFEKVVLIRPKEYLHL